MSELRARSRHRPPGMCRPSDANRRQRPPLRYGGDIASRSLPQDSLRAQVYHSFHTHTSPRIPSQGPHLETDVQATQDDQSSKSPADIGDDNNKTLICRGNSPILRLLSILGLQFSFGRCNILRKSTAQVGRFSPRPASSKQVLTWSERSILTEQDNRSKQLPHYQIVKVRSL